ncbi:hypothetical protein GN958_ATG00401 [Phytophthora infestans]|uniref:Uncharacterized protein n=1 Tax=Phytophthora infestans TaxID=4787 RepID=A0A8S9VCG1_PHYIN|nr:hypothetical protein GN958_ATG00401 [Phytophthora infestans]
MVGVGSESSSTKTHGGDQRDDHHSTEAGCNQGKHTESVVKIKTASNHGKQYTQACINVLLDEDGEGQTLSWATARGFRNLAPTPSSLNAADDYFECAPVVM